MVHIILSKTAFSEKVSYQRKVIPAIIDDFIYLFIYSNVSMFKIHNLHVVFTERTNLSGSLLITFI